MTPDADRCDHVHCSLDTTLSCEQVAGLYGAIGWGVRKCGWHQYEVVCPWAEPVIEAERPVLVHGPLDDALAHLEELLAPLRSAGATFRGECYGPDQELLREFNR